MPLALIAVGSGLKDMGIDTIIVDGRLEKDPEAVLATHLDDSLCLGISVLTGADIRDALRIGKMAKRLRPDLPVVWGGWHPSLFPREILAEASEVDVVVRAQGETALRELVEAWRDGRPLDSIAGIAFRDGDEIVETAPRPMEAMDGLPAANYSLIPIRRYFELKKQRQLDFVTSTGCRYRCRFCADPFVFKRGWTGLSADRVVERVSALVADSGAIDVNFQDETFFTDRQRTLDIAQGFIKRDLGFTWAATMRADQGCRLTADDWDLLKRSGLRKLLIGVEAGSERMLKRLGKDITLEQIEEVAQRCRETDISATYPFIYGLPGETPEDLNASLQLAQYLTRMHWSNTTPFFCYKPYPGSALTDEIVADGHILPKSLEGWAQFDYVTTTSPWVDEETERNVRRFAFFNQLGWSRPRRLAAPLQALARWRCRRSFFAFPLEKVMVEAVMPSDPLV
jgi:radical SAM superfamily enzyme YgiQ (UPF0313 family)